MLAHLVLGGLQVGHLHMAFAVHAESLQVSPPLLCGHQSCGIRAPLLWLHLT